VNGNLVEIEDRPCLRLGGWYGQRSAFESNPGGNRVTKTCLRFCESFGGSRISIEEAGGPTKLLGILGPLLILM
jgi:hypothetical protein